VDKKQLKKYLIGDFSMTRLLSSLIFIYGAVGLWAYFGSDRLMFLPPPASYQDKPPFIKLKNPDQQSITAVYLPNSQAKYTILYSHGNAEDLGDILPRLYQLRDLGVNVFAYDYQGYGTSYGSPSEINAYQDINTAYEYLTQQLKIQPGKIIVYGRSIGSGPSVDLASRQPVGGLILESAFTTIFRVVTKIPLYPFDKFANIQKIPQVSAPVLVLHGDADMVIPFAHGQELFNAVTHNNKLSLWVTGAGHNDLLETAGNNYIDKMQEFLQLLDQGKK
jgi:fermentation-respiration switch protein FrsA (DUF1100 family)